MGDHVIEVMLLRYGDTSASGRTVTFQLPDEGEHPFKGLKTGASNGQRLALSVVLIADDESQHEIKPGELTGTSIPDKPKGGRLAQQAGIACGDKRFWAFLMEDADARMKGILNQDDATREVYRNCGINSRAQLDHDEIAAAKWDAIHSEYTAWLIT